MGQLYGCDIYRITNVNFVPLKRPSEFIDPRIIELQQLASSGIFYFASSSNMNQLFDLTLSSQKRACGEFGDTSYFWNRNLHLPLQRYGIEPSEWFLRVICGSIQIRTVYIGCKIAKVAVISRLSCNRVGTRFNVRGINDDGHVANFIETEQV
ncbi:unnamed protein product [Dracunculus medinensis]|uniref:Phosphatidylinositol-3-phosphatase SAC1 n=1 Tax=Dracunculus medinensis TaxID=318479 RepID=A0A0N4UHI3_DRAME|nr:unnamed protein product [Dracunculus medinensis]